MHRGGWLSVLDLAEKKPARLAWIYYRYAPFHRYRDGHVSFRLDHDSLKHGSIWGGLNRGKEPCSRERSCRLTSVAGISLALVARVCSRLNSAPLLASSEGEHPEHVHGD